MIIRSKRKTNFTVMSNVGLRDERLSFKARGMLAYMLSMPDNWKVSDRHLATVGPDGRHLVQAALKELEECGYLVREQRHMKNGTFVWDSVIYDEPQVESTMARKPNHGESTMARLSSHGKPNHGSVESTMARKPNHIVSTSTEVTNTKEGEAPPPKPKKQPPEPESPFVQAVREIALQSPSKAQRPLIDNTVTDMELWREVLGYWVNRGWNPRNVFGMVDLYQHPERMKQRKGQNNGTGSGNVEEDDDYDPEFAKHFAEHQARVRAQGIQM